MQRHGKEAVLFYCFLSAYLSHSKVPLANIDVAAMLQQRNAGSPATTNMYHNAIAPS